MTSRLNCPKGRRKPGSPCVFCEDGAYCAHQYYCPNTRRYENTEFSKCKRLEQAYPPEPTPVRRNRRRRGRTKINRKCENERKEN